MIINGNKEYKENEFIHFVREFTGEAKVIETVKATNGTRKYKEYDMREIPFNDIISFRLNTVGENVPFTSNGVINVNRYLFWFWTPVIGADTISLYTLLTEYCDDETDICYPKTIELAERLGVTKKTVANKLKALQEHNFILIINRLNKMANMKETSPLFKIRRTVPMLSREQLSELPIYLQEKHKKFIEKYGDDVHQDNFLADSEESLGVLLSNSERVITKKDREKINKVIENSQVSEYILVNLTPYQNSMSEHFHNMLKDRWNPKTYDTLFEDSICVYDEVTNKADIVLSETGKVLGENINHFNETILGVLNDLLPEKVENFKIYTFKEYILKIEREK